jgi:hypothetical protein
MSAAPADLALASVHGVRTDEGSPRGCQAEQAVSLLYAVKEYRAAAAELAGLARDDQVSFSPD